LDSSPQRGRGHFPEDPAVGYGETPRLLELIGSSYLGDARSCRIGTPQRCARQIQASQQKIPARTDSQEFSAAHPQSSFGHADRRAKFKHGRLADGVSGQLVLESDHETGVMPPRFEIIANVIGRQAIEKRVEKLLLKGSRDLWVRDYFASRFG
jgi:hypothetical protein